MYYSTPEDGGGIVRSGGIVGGSDVAGVSKKNLPGATLEAPVITLRQH